MTSTPVLAAASHLIPRALELAPWLPAGGAGDLLVSNPFDGSTIGRLAQQSPSDLDAILSRAHRGARATAALARHERAAILNGAATRLEQAADHMRDLIVAEAGKTRVQAQKEVARAINTLRLSAIEAQQNAGELIPFAAYPGSEQRQGWFTREPLGIITAITPYNDALNLVAHKLGPAIAGANAVILKPSQLTPFVARALVRLLLDSGLPEESVTVVHGDRALAGAIIKARDVRLVSFTGGFATAGAIAASAGLKRLSMELGGNAPVLVFEDATIDAAVDACVSGAFWAAGQNCIGAQRIMVHRNVYDVFVERLVRATAALAVGDPMIAGIDVGPMISTDSAIAAVEKIRAAVEAGATLLTGGTRRGSLLSPTVLADVPRSCEVWADEVFAPIVAVESFDDESAALQRANAVDYALHAAVFTADLERALRVSAALDAGGVMINDSSDYRFDGMPFGGSKYGSMGREGVRFAYEEMTQPKVICINRDRQAAER